MHYPNGTGVEARHCVIVMLPLYQSLIEL